MIALATLLACGGSVALQQPHDPPVWPMDNLVVDKPRAEVPEPAPEPAEAPEPDPEPEPAGDDRGPSSPSEAP